MSKGLQLRLHIIVFLLIELKLNGSALLGYNSAMEVTRRFEISLICLPVEANVFGYVELQ
jgi:hypothetical protein